MSITYISTPNAIPHRINGQAFDTADGGSAKVFDSTLDRVARQVQLASEADVIAAVASAEP